MTDLETAQALLKANPNSADNWYGVAMLYLKAGDLDQTIEHLAHVSQLEPTIALHYANQGRILFALERFEEAQEAYSKAIDLQPTAQLYSSRSVINAALGKSAAALSDLNAAYEFEPTAAKLLDRAAFFANKGMAVDALRDVGKVIEMQPTDPNHRLTHANLAFALASHYPELYEVGLQDIEAALELDATGILQSTLLELAHQLETHLSHSPNPTVSQRLINLIRSK